MLGINKLSPGRIGNRLFHYNFLRQIAKKTGIDYFHIKFPESKYLLEMRKKPRYWPNFNKPVEVFSRDALAIPPEYFLDFIFEQNKKGRDILFSPPMLGEVFFDYLFFGPNEFIEVREPYRVGFEFDPTNKVIIGLHFRGSDFPTWNTNAALKFDYYDAAVNDCLAYFNDEEVVFAVFTDDYEYPAYVQTLSLLRSLSHTQIRFGDKDALPIYDFYKMTQCDVLISSPSTFAIFAGILGKQKKIIHSKFWLDYAIDRNDVFWVRLQETTNLYYRLWKTF